MCDKAIETLFARNKAWAAARTSADADFFRRLSDIQSPEYLWIGCSDSRVPANEIVGLDPGEMFVHRNIANIVPHTDLNCLSVIQFAVEVLKVKHVIVTGHYGCGGIRAAMSDQDFGQIENWLAHIRDVHHQHYDEISAIADEDARVDRMCELNVAEQARNVARTSIVQNAWKRGQSLQVHGWIYALRDGILKDLKVSIRSIGDLHAAQRVAG